MLDHDTIRPRAVHFLVAGLGYWACGKLSLTLALPTGYSAPLWPGSGLALVGVLTYGWRILPALLAGSFVLNAGIAFDFSGLTPIVRSASLALLHSSGQLGEAVVGAGLVRRFVGWPSALGRPREIGAFVGLAGPVACVISASVGNATLYAVGVLPGSALPISWLTWWVGDVIGVVLVAPLLLAFVGRPHDIWRRRRVAVGLPVAVTVLVFAAGYLLAARAETARIRQGFERDTDTRIRVLEQSLARSVDALHALRALFRGSPRMSPEQFAAAASEIGIERVGLQAVQWLPRVGAAERDAFEREARRTVAAAFSITERTARGEVVPRAPAPEYFPILLTEPLAGNERVLGFDPASEATRAAVIQAATASGEPIASEPVDLVQESAHQAGVLVFLPFYGAGPEPRTVEERRRRCAGFLVAVYRAGDFLRASMRGVESPGILLAIRDGPTRRRIYAADTGDAPDPLPAAAGLERHARIPLPGRDWEARLWATPGYVAERRSIAPWAILAGGLVLSGFLGAFLLRETGRAAEVEAVVVERTAALQQANLELEALSLLDGLTQVANRRSLDAYLLREWERGQRDHSPLSLLMCDIDHFKAFNDARGHPAGDDLLVRVARAIRAGARRPADVTGRYGGEEFAVILPGTTIQGAVEVAQEVRRNVAALGAVTLSVGVACLVPRAGLTLESLVTQADRALYSAKKGGRNRVAVDPPGDTPFRA